MVKILAALLVLAPFAASAQTASDIVRQFGSDGLPHSAATLTTVPALTGFTGGDLARLLAVHTASVTTAPRGRPLASSGFIAADLARLRGQTFAIQAPVMLAMP